MRAKLKVLVYETWFQILISSIWFLILAKGGLLNIYPLWFRILIIPVLGIPSGIFFILDLRYMNKDPNIGNYLLHIFILGPIVSLLGGLFLGTIAYYISKLIFNL